MSDAPHSCQRTVAVEMFNHTWDLLDAGERSPDKDRELLASAYASYSQWRKVGEPKNHSISDWQVARVWSVLGDAARSAEHAAESLRIAEEHDLGAFYVAYAYEALARAALVAGEGTTCRQHVAAADATVAAIDDKESAAMVQADLDEIRAQLDS